MSLYVLSTGSTIEYDDSLVLAPDAVTEQIAEQAVLALKEKTYAEKPPHILELGIGTGAFCKYILDCSGVVLDVTGVDNDPNALQTAFKNLYGHERLGNLCLVDTDWNSDAALESQPYDCIYFNPPYLPVGANLRPAFADAPPSAVYSQDPYDSFATLLPKLVKSLNVGGIALIRYPGNGALTFAGDDAKSDHNPWVSLDVLDRTFNRLIDRSEWLRSVMPADTRSFMWRSWVNDRRINAEIFTRIGESIDNAPKIIRDMDAYWSAYE